MAATLFVLQEWIGSWETDSSENVGELFYFGISYLFVVWDVIV